MLTEQEFQQCLRMIRSEDPMTFEEGYQWIQGSISAYLEPLIAQLEDAEGWYLRSKFIELLGDANDERAIPALEGELSHPDSQVRGQAWSALMYSALPEANQLAERYRAEHPEEDFYV